MLGHWDNFDDMEINISIPELNAILEAARKKEMERNRFAAALKGISLDDDEDAKDVFNEVEARAKAKLSGKSTEEFEMAELGFGVEEETEE